MEAHKETVFKNEDIKEAVIEVPEGHRHLRTTILIQDGQRLIFQEATIANIVRAYVTVKTSPTVKRVRLVGLSLPKGERKPGYASWQLIEEG